MSQITGVKLSKVERIAAKKQYKKTLNLLKEYNDDITLSEHPTAHLFIGNGGMLCGVSREQILGLFAVHGLISELIMLPRKSFSFLSYQTVCTARNAVTILNGYAFSNDTNVPSSPLYLSYLKTQVQNKDVDTIYEYPVEGDTNLVEGLLLETDFITEKYENELCDFFKICDKQELDKPIKHRSVKHFGYEFLYGSNNIDRSKPLSQKIPSICNPLIEKMLEQKLITFTPDQLTVNQYQPGQGIPPHIDTHSAFEDGIISLSLQSEVVMDFVDPNGHQRPVILPRRSLIVMTGESRYLWTHGITPRKHDIIYAKDSEIDTVEHLTLKERKLRISLTFRKILHTPCSCNYKEQCDSQQCNKGTLYIPRTSSEASNLEGEHVYEVYEKIAEHFSGTRHTPWPRVKEFLCSLPNGSLVADIGCGNGKYLGVNEKIMTIGSDRSFNLASICDERGFQVIVSDCLLIPYRSNTFDASICIAVIHHLSTEARRLEALKELVRITQFNGLVLVYVWALEQSLEVLDSKASFNSQCDKDKEEDGEHICCNYSNGDIKDRSKIEVNEGRYTFQQQDLLIPWHLKDGSKAVEAEVFHRFYHVFLQGELQNLCSKLENVNIESIYFDRGNWCAILRKIF